MFRKLVYEVMTAHMSGDQEAFRKAATELNLFADALHRQSPQKLWNALMLAVAKPNGGLADDSTAILELCLPLWLTKSSSPWKA